MSQLTIFQRLLSRRLLTSSSINRRYVSTTKKTNDTATVTNQTAVERTPQLTQTNKTDQNWVSYGFETSSKEDDRNAMHSIMFVSVTLCLVIGGLYLAYIPDYHLRDWAQREAFLELRRREQNNLPLVDPNFIDPSKIELPSDEELGNTEIII